MALPPMFVHPTTGELLNPNTGYPVGEDPSVFPGGKSPFLSPEQQQPLPQSPVDPRAELSDADVLQQAAVSAGHIQPPSLPPPVAQELQGAPGGLQGSDVAGRLSPETLPPAGAVVEAPGQEYNPADTQEEIVAARQQVANEANDLRNKAAENRAVAKVGQERDLANMVGERIDKRAADRKKHMDALDKTGELKNPFANVSTPLKIGAVVAGAIGGFLSVSTGSGKNQFLDTLQGVIDRDLAMQKANIDREIDKLMKKDASLDSQLELDFRKDLMKTSAEYSTLLATADIMETRAKGLSSNDSDKALELLQAVALYREQAAERRALAEMKIKKGSGVGGKTKIPPGYSGEDTGQVYIDRGQKVYASDMQVRDPDRWDKINNELIDVPIIKTGTKERFAGFRLGNAEVADKIMSGLQSAKLVQIQAHRILELATDPDTGELRSPTEMARFFGNTPEGAAAAQEFGRMMVALKDSWKLGAIQKPDENLIKGFTGENPVDFVANMTTLAGRNQLLPMMRGLASGEQIRLKSEYSGYVPAGYEIDWNAQLPTRAESTSDIKARRSEESQTGEPFNLKKTSKNIVDQFPGVGPTVSPLSQEEVDSVQADEIDRIFDAGIAGRDWARKGITSEQIAAKGAVTPEQAISELETLAKEYAPFPSKGPTRPGARVFNAGTGEYEKVGEQSGSVNRFSPEVHSHIQAKIKKLKEALAVGGKVKETVKERASSKKEFYEPGTKPQKPGIIKTESDRIIKKYGK